MKNKSFLSADKTKKSDRIAIGKFYYPLKASKFKDSFDGIDEYYIQKKYNGTYIQIHKSRESISIFNAQGKNITSVIPDIAKEIDNLKINETIFESMLELWKDNKNQGKKEVDKYIQTQLKKEKNSNKESSLVANIFDILWIQDEKDIHNLPYKERYKILHDIDIKQSIVDIPNFKRSKLNLAPTSFVKNKKDLDKSLQYYLKSKASKGAVIKMATMKYHFNGISNEMFEVNIKESKKKKKKESINNFVLQHHWWESKNVEHWDLLIDIGKKYPLHYILESNPFENKEISFYTKLCKDKNDMQKGVNVERLQCGTKWNPSLSTLAWIGIVDSGKVKLLENKNAFKKFEFEGKKINGLYTTKKEKDSSTWWTFSRLQGKESN